MQHLLLVLKELSGKYVNILTVQTSCEIPQGQIVKLIRVVFPVSTKKKDIADAKLFSIITKDLSRGHGLHVLAEAGTLQSPL